MANNNDNGKVWSGISEGLYQTIVNDGVIGEISDDMLQTNIDKFTDSVESNPTSAYNQAILDLCTTEQARRQSK